MKKHFNIQLLDDGGQGGAGANGGQGGNAGNGNGSQGNAGNNGGNGGATFSFQQAEEIANARAARAERAALASYFQQQGLSEDQINQAIADYKAQQAARQPNVDTITKERDEARAELAAIKNGQKLTQLGVRPEFSRFVLSEIDALMKEDSKLDLSLREKAYLQMDADAEKILALLDSYEGALPFSDKASPEVITHETGMSKNEFKRAVGRLLKQGKIEIGERTIRRKK